ncbi:hypothetical protein Q4Q39_09455 [Flavivirga amylovorans]|uniref:T9SS C-terminal target domain-containing protein n=1 Tax=Flavivirga amylovorans TaxID=870486 RepID=A0ABT8X1N5_9FLAO|nr:hypothetical protein [Flavivirga amylovorans]MDO5987623.1 hypothetical protein [Flavivirga amylovorans]
MRKIIQIVVLLLLTGSASAQQEKGIIGTDNWLNNWTDFDPKSADYGEPNEILTGNITEDKKLYKKDIYLLMGNVFVTDSVTLTIEPGTVIIGDWESQASLTIAKGATIMAEGLETDPIVFTSNRSVKKPGDWGGIILLGDAPTNKFGNGSVASMYANLDQSSYQHTNYGGENVKSNSGVLKYVRIEYAGGGKKGRGAAKFDGLLLAGVGNETVLENIMVSYCEGDSFEVMGGGVNFVKAVSYSSNSNDFKFNLGTQSRLDNSLAIRSPYATSSKGARCLDISSYDKKEQVDFTKPGTSIIAKNMTMLNMSDDLNSHIQLGLIKEAVFIGEKASLDINKSVISGFNPAVILDDKIIINQENLEKIKFVDMFFNNCNGNIFKEYNSNNEDLENWYGNRSFYNVYSKTQNSETFIDLKNRRRPDYRLRINKIIAANGKN